MLSPIFAAGLNVNWLLLPLIITVSLVYNATRYELPEKILRRSLRMGIYIFAFMGGSMAILYLFS
jgi:hypothetical protein